MKQFRYILGLVKRSFIQRRALIAQLENSLKNISYRENFLQAFKYFPEGLEYNDIKILRLVPSSRIGNDNKLIISKTKYPSGEKESLISLGKNCWTGRNVEINILTGTQVIIKDYSTIQDNCKIIGDITIERYCVFAPMVYASSGNHYAEKGNPDIIRNQDFDHLSNEQLFRQHSKKVHFEEDCWVGIGAFIGQGIYIGRGAVIGAHAVVTKNVMPYSIIVSNNKVVNQRFEFIPPGEVSAVAKEHVPYFYRGFFQKNTELESLPEQGIAIFENNSAVIILANQSFSEISVSGKTSVLKGNIPGSIIFNGHIKAVVDFATDKDGNFSKSIPFDFFTSALDEDSDYVYGLSKYYNVFKISLINNLNINEGQYFGIKNFKQVIL